MNTNFTLLTKDQVFGEDRLDIFKKGITMAKSSDFANLLGASYGYIDATHCDWATQSLYKNSEGFKDIYLCLSDGNLTHLSMNDKNNTKELGVRPAIKYTDIELLAVNKIVNRYGIKVVEYGEYPQTVADDELSEELEANYVNSTLVHTTKCYTMPDIKREDVNYFTSDKLIEYEYNGERYVRFVNDSVKRYIHIHNGKDWILTNSDRRVFWIKVEPIKWLVDEKNNIALSEKVLFSGIRFYLDNSKTYNFNKSNIKRFLDEYFSREILTLGLMKTDSKSIKEILNELESLRNEMSELTNNKKVKRYIEIVSEIVSLTEQLRLVYSDEDIEQAKVKKKINKNTLTSNIFEQD